MTREDIIRMAKEAGFSVQKWDDGVDEVMDGDNYHIQTDQVIDFANLVAAAERDRIADEAKHIIKRAEARGADAERNKIAQWIMARGYATGHGDTVEDLLKEFNWQVREEERELCAQICEQIADAPSNMVLGVALDCAEAIRARENK